MDRCGKLVPLNETIITEQSLPTTYHLATLIGCICRPPSSWIQRDAIRGATFDLLSGQAQDQFDHLGRDAWATLSDEDRYALQWRVLRSPEPPSA